MIDKEYNKILKQYHKLSDRHILVVETDMPYSDVLKVVVLSDKIRKAGNELVRLMRKNYDQLLRTKRYRKLLFLYGTTEDKSKRKIQDEVDDILTYLAEPEIVDNKAVNTLIEDTYCIDTYRPCYATLVPKMIRGNTEYICTLLSRAKQSQNMISMAILVTSMVKG